MCVLELNKLFKHTIDTLGGPNVRGLTHYAMVYRSDLNVGAVVISGDAPAQGAGASS